MTTSDMLLFVGAAALAACLAALVSAGREPIAADILPGDNGGGVYDPPAEDADQLPTVLESVQAKLTGPWEILSGGGGPAELTGPLEANIRAGLDMIAYAEGTARYPHGGYKTMFSGVQFESYADHPRRRFEFANKRGERLYTTAAGRYQFLSRTWDEVARKLGLQDFGPANQDAACIELIRQRGALADLKAGRVAEFVAKCAKTWASLPGAGYAQPERKLETLLAAYTRAGGTIAS